MNSRFSLAVHVLCLLATEPEERMTSDFLAMSIGANAVAIRRMMSSLREAGLVTAKRAGGGGWLLARPAVEIMLDQVRHAMAKEETLRMHKNEPHPDCPVGKGVRQALHGVYNRADEAIDRELAGITVSDMLAAAVQAGKRRGRAK